MNRQERGGGTVHLLHAGNDVGNDNGPSTPHHSRREERQLQVILHDVDPREGGRLKVDGHAWWDDPVVQRGFPGPA